MQTDLTPLSLAILRVLHVAQEQDGLDKGMSLARLGKQLGLSASALLRTLAPMGDVPMAGQPCLAWVKVRQGEGRQTVHLTDAGKTALRLQDDGRILQQF